MGEFRTEQASPRQAPTGVLDCRGQGPGARVRGRGLEGGSAAAHSVTLNTRPRSAQGDCPLHWWGGTPTHTRAQPGLESHPPGPSWCLVLALEGSMSQGTDTPPSGPLRAAHPDGGDGSVQGLRWFGHEGPDQQSPPGSRCCSCPFPGCAVGLVLSIHRAAPTPRARRPGPARGRSAVWPGPHAGLLLGGTGQSWGLLLKTISGRWAQ